ncbi:MAG TPA: response regulator [Coleofasciculaceae cyanobacterium]|jgi:signal transduction histidine kinase/DNA-binding response OmpR family regulator
MLTYKKLLTRTSYPNLTRLLRSESGENSLVNQKSKLEPADKLNYYDLKDFALQTKIEDRASKTDNLTTTSATILIVDDTPHNLQVLFAYLETAGFKVLLAQDGESALQIAQSQTPDLILLDVLMPDIDGFATCSQLKAQASTKEIPVIFLTALSETVNKVQGFKLGGVDYITKPTEQEEVLARIQTHLNLQRMRQALAAQNKKLQQTLNFEALIRRITDKLRDSLDETYCLRVATKELATVLNLSSCQVELYDAQQVTATIVYEHNVTLPSCQGETRQINDFPELYQQLLQKYPIQLVEPIPQFNPQGIQVTRLACPIFDDRNIIGNLWGLKPPGELFTSLEIRLMQQVASQCAIAIRQARLYANSNRQVAELAKLNQIKDDFLKTVSHELKAPMSSIQLAAQTLENLLNTKQNPSQSPLFKRVLQIFYQSCQRQKKLTDDLLTICYVDAKAKVVQPELIELNPWLTNLIRPYLKPIKKQRKLILDLATQKLQIFADLAILERITQELLNNAYQYAPVDGEIILQTLVTKSEVSIRIINTGIEISPEEQKLIFDQFYCIPHENSRKNGGTGLGLTLVKKLAETLNASVEFESNSQRTMFGLKFPLESN